MDQECGFEVFCFAGGVGDAKEWVDGVAAAAVDDGAGGAEEGAAEGGVWVGGLVGEEAVDHKRRPDMCVDDYNHVRVTIANPHHADLTRAEERLAAKVDAVIERHHPDAVLSW